MYNLYKWLLVLLMLGVCYLLPVYIAVSLPEKLIASTALTISVFAIAITLISTKFFKIIDVKIEITPIDTSDNPLCDYNVMVHNYKSSSIFVSRVDVKNCTDHYDCNIEDSFWLSKGESVFSKELEFKYGVVHPDEYRCVFRFRAPLSAYPYIGYKDISRKNVEICLTLR